MSKNFLGSIIEAHGGLERFSNLSSIDLKFDFTGATLSLKGRHTHLTPTASVSTTEHKVTYRGLGGPADEAWVFTPSKVAFADHRMDTPWDDLHFIYFTGFALWQYTNFPYLLSRDDIHTKELASHKEVGETWRVLEVTFPDQSVLATHSRVQKYYFNDKLELVRHDYSPDVLDGAPAAHYTFDSVVVAGMKFPTMRRVVALDPNGRPMYNGPIPTLINLVIRRIDLKERGNTGGEQKDWELTDAPPSE